MRGTTHLPRQEYHQMDGKGSNGYDNNNGSRDKYANDIPIIHPHVKSKVDTFDGVNYYVSGEVDELSEASEDYHDNLFGRSPTSIVMDKVNKRTSHSDKVAGRRFPNHIINSQLKPLNSSWSQSKQGGGSGGKRVSSNTSPMNRSLQIPSDTIIETPRITRKLSNNIPIPKSKKKSKMHIKRLRDKKRNSKEPGSDEYFVSNVMPDEQNSDEEAKKKSGAGLALYNNSEYDLEEAFNSPDNYNGDPGLHHLVDLEEEEEGDVEQEEEDSSVLFQHDNETMRYGEQLSASSTNSSSFINPSLFPSTSHIIHASSGKEMLDHHGNNTKIVQRGISYLPRQLTASSSHSLSSASLSSKGGLKRGISGSGSQRKSNMLDPAAGLSKAKQIIEMFIKEKKHSQSKINAAAGSLQRIEAEGLSMSDEELVLQALSLQELPFVAYIEDLIDFVHVLRLGQNRICYLGKDLARMVHLEKLYLFNNELNEYSFEFSFERMTCLRELDLSGNQLTRIPKTFATIPSLRSLNLHSNLIASFSEEETKQILPIVGKDLSILNLGFNKLSHLPPEFSLVFPKLERLHLQGNVLLTLPRDIAKMKYLKTLDVKMNPLQLPPIGACKSLESIKDYFDDLDRNKNVLNWDEFIRSHDEQEIETLPDNHEFHTEEEEYLQQQQIYEEHKDEESVQGDETQARTAQSYSEKVIVPTPLSTSLPESIIGSSLEEQKVIAKADKSTVRKFKVIVVGPPLSGKTSMLKTLLSDRKILQNIKDRTIGIDIEDLRLSTKSSSGDDVHLMFKCWDFAGQQIYMGTHQLFFSRDSIYLLVCDVKKCRTPDDIVNNIFFWVYSIQNRVPGAIIQLVISQTEGLSQSDLDSVWENINNEFKNHEVYRIKKLEEMIKSCKSESGNDRIKKAEERDFNNDQIDQLTYISRNPPQLEQPVFISVESNMFGIPELKKKLVNFAFQEEKFMFLRKMNGIPASWKMIQDSLDELRKEGCKIVSVNSLLQKVFPSLHQESEEVFNQNRSSLINCLHVLSSRGDIVLHEPQPLAVSGNWGIENYILFLEPKWLMWMIKVLVNHSIIAKNDEEKHEMQESKRQLDMMLQDLSDEEHEELQDYRKDLYEHAILNEKLLPYLWKEIYNGLNEVSLSEIMQVLESLDICCEIDYHQVDLRHSTSNSSLGSTESQPSSKKYLVPCLLSNEYKITQEKMVSDISLVNLKMNDQITMSRKIILSGYCPIDLMSRLILRLSAKGHDRRYLPVDKAFPYANALKFRCIGKSKKYDVVIFMKNLTILNSNGDRVIDLMAFGPLSEILSIWRSMLYIQKIMIDVIKRQPNLRPTVQVRCPSCLLDGKSESDTNWFSDYNLKKYSFPFPPNSSLNKFLEDFYFECKYSRHECPTILLTCPPEWYDLDLDLEISQTKGLPDHIVKSTVRIEIIDRSTRELRDMATGFVYNRKDGKIIAPAHLFQHYETRQNKHKNYEILIACADNVRSIPTWRFKAKFVKYLGSSDPNTKFIDVAIIQAICEVSLVDGKLRDGELKSMDSWFFEHEISLATQNDHNDLQILSPVTSAGYPALVSTIVVQSSKVNSIDDDLICAIMTGENGGSGSPLILDSSQKVIGILSHTRGESTFTMFAKIVAENIL